MKLSYRGLSYETKMSSTLLQKTWMIAQFRGLVYRLNRPIFTNKHYSQPLKYRGVSYQTIQSTPIRIESEPITTPQSTLPQELPHQS